MNIGAMVLIFSGFIFELFRRKEIFTDQEKVFYFLRYAQKFKHQYFLFTFLRISDSNSRDLFDNCTIVYATAIFYTRDGWKKENYV